MFVCLQIDGKQCCEATRQIALNTIELYAFALCGSVWHLFPKLKSHVTTVMKTMVRIVTDGRLFNYTHTTKKPLKKQKVLNVVSSFEIAQCWTWDQLIRGSAGYW